MVCERVRKLLHITNTWIVVYSEWHHIYSIIEMAILESCIITNKYLVEVVVGLQIVQDVEYFL